MRRAKDRVDLDKPFTVTVTPDPDGSGMWLAHLIGHELDNQTCGNDAVDALFMAYDLLAALADVCTGQGQSGADHDYSLATILDEEHAPDVPAWGCTKCGARVRKDDVEES